MEYNELLDKVKDGKFVKIKFYKRTTGELREMVCRFGVKKHAKGVGLAFNPKNKNLLSVWEPSRGYRFVPLEGIISVKHHGQEDK